MFVLRNGSLVLLVLGAALALSVINAVVQAPGARAAAARPVIDAVERREVALINSYRRSHGLRALKVDLKLSRAATWMSQDMARGHYFAHTDRQGRSPYGRMAVFGYPSNSWRGENLAAAIGPPKLAFRAWRNSPEHNANMLDPHFRAIGVSRVYSASSVYGWYWTTDFGSTVTRTI